MNELDDASDCSRRAREAMADLEIELAKMQHQPVAIALEWVETPPACPVAGLYLLRDRRSAFCNSHIHDAAKFGEGEDMSPETWPECCGPIVIGGAND